MPCKRKKIKWATKPPIKKEKKRAREKDGNRFAKQSPNFGFCACEKQKSCLLITSD